MDLVFAGSRSNAVTSPVDADLSTIVMDLLRVSEYINYK